MLHKIKREVARGIRMFKKKCSLCGGDLVSGKCQECGLDNTRKRMYQVNEGERGSKTFAEHEKREPHGGVSNEEFFSQMREDQEALEKQSTYTRTSEQTKQSTQGGNRRPEGMPPFGRPPMGHPASQNHGDDQRDRPKRKISPIGMIVILFFGIQIFSVVFSVVFAIIESMFAIF